MKLVIVLLSLLSIAFGQFGGGTGGIQYNYWNYDGLSLKSIIATIDIDSLHVRAMTSDSALVPDLTASLVYDFPITMVQDIGFDFGFTAFGLVPYAQFDTAGVDTATAYLQYRVPALYIGSLPSIIFEWVASDTMFAGDTLSFEVIQVQSEPGAISALIDTLSLNIVIAADTLFPGYNISDSLAMDTTVASSNNLVISRPVADDYPGILGIVGWSITIPPNTTP
jgi:hypothetical protein